MADEPHRRSTVAGVCYMGIHITLRTKATTDEAGKLMSLHFHVHS